ncbi:S66 family peptidase [Xylocopilactobacillus apicola]|uniref:LD-carboxypeptidase n=1 Tax=Xylocopilactobacillus apicola TaxID=2932184 RepID=A0AAU9DLP9_9LACO|nr:S66 peptidase family protein [Xylocopilactobacillus apicola]BDR59476.1 LD-carboxypeptidase [Xylocopilactobacillus apicola]
MLNLPSNLEKGDRIAIVSLSRGTLGEKSAKHQLDLGLKRLQELGLKPELMPNALKGVKYLAAHPEARAADLKAAFYDSRIKGIFCAIGGLDTYRILPHIMEDSEFVRAVLQHPKLFSGFSDTTINHLMFHRLGLRTYYGPNFINDLAELDSDLLPKTKETIMRYFSNPSETAITSSPVWYEERTDFSEKALGTVRPSHVEEHGYEVLRGQGVVTGELLGGCLDSLHDMIHTTIPKISDEDKVIAKYQIFPSKEEWQGKILFIETSEMCPDAEFYRHMLEDLKAWGIFQNINGIIVGKPQNEKNYEEYKAVLLDVTSDFQLPIIYNVNFGHSYPRVALPYGARVELDLDHPAITVKEPFFRN